MHQSHLTISSLYDALHKVVLSCQCPVTGNHYIPSETIHENITWPVVKELLPLTYARRFLPCWDYNLVSKIQGARKVIAILLLISHSNAIESLLFEELTDEDLPLSQNANGAYLLSLGSEKIFRAFKTWEPGARAMFLEKQWMVLEPKLRLDATPPVNIQLDTHSALKLAFDSCVKVTKTEDSTTHVYKGVLRPEHQHGLNNSGDVGPVCVAVKKFVDKAAFKQERTVLDMIYSKHIKNDHLIRHLVICHGISCIIFPWADGGDLWDFWKRDCPREQCDFLWCLGQMAGLAHALKDLHDGNLRHGDLKPMNILHFWENGAGILKIADVGVSRAHTTVTGLRKGKTTTSASTPTYQGPEAYKSNLPRSRRYDCWSMGCIILEFVVWLLYDFRALESFWGALDHESYGYYRLKKPACEFQVAKPSEKADVHPTVGLAMECLRADPRSAGTALEALVNLVEGGLLKIDPEDRLEASDLHERLRAIFECAQKDSTYLVKKDAISPAVPEIFDRPPVSSDPESTMQQNSCTQNS